MRFSVDEILPIGSPSLLEAASKRRIRFLIERSQVDDRIVLFVLAKYAVLIHYGIFHAESPFNKVMIPTNPLNEVFEVPFILDLHLKYLDEFIALIH